MQGNALWTADNPGIPPHTLRKCVEFYKMAAIKMCTGRGGEKRLPFKISPNMLLVQIDEV